MAVEQVEGFPGAQTNMVTSVTTQLSVIEIDFIDTSEFHDKVEEHLAGGTANHTGTTVSTNLDLSSTTAGSEPGGFNLGLLVPLVIVTTILVTVIVYVIWNTVQKHKRERQSMEVLSRMGRSSMINGTTHPDLTGVSRNIIDGSVKEITYTPGEYKSRLPSIRESPEDKLASLVNVITSVDGGASQGSSNMSVFRGLNIDFWSGTPEFPQSFPTPIVNSEESQSFPNLNVHATAPYSPYRLTWMSPKHARSEPVIVNANMRHPGSLSGLTNSVLAYNNASWKSPYHPNFNTPTNESDGSLPLPEGIYINRQNSAQPNSQSRTTSMMENCGSAPPSIARSAQGSTGCSPPPPYEESSEMSGTLYEYSTYRTPEATENCTPLSWPSHIGMWQYNDLYSGPNRHTLMQSMNSDLMMMQGSVNYANQLQSTANHNSQFHGPNVLANTPDATPYHVVLTRQGLDEHNSMERSDSHSKEGMTSGNTSTCVQMDSCESSQFSGSNVTNTFSRENSGYQAGPSHSTSITGPGTSVNPSLNPSPNFVPIPENTNNININGISAIYVNAAFDPDSDADISEQDTSSSAATIGSRQTTVAKYDHVDPKAVLDTDELTNETPTTVIRNSVLQPSATDDEKARMSSSEQSDVGEIRMRWRQSRQSRLSSEKADIKRRSGSEHGKVHHNWDKIRPCDDRMLRKMQRQGRTLSSCESDDACLLKNQADDITDKESPSKKFKKSASATSMEWDDFPFTGDRDKTESPPETGTSTEVHESESASEDTVSSRLESSRRSISYRNAINKVDSIKDLEDNHSIGNQETHVSDNDTNVSNKENIVPAKQLAKTDQPKEQHKTQSLSNFQYATHTAPTRALFRKGLSEINFNPHAHYYSSPLEHNPDAASPIFVLQHEPAVFSDSRGSNARRSMESGVPQQIQMFHREPRRASTGQQRLLSELRNSQIRNDAWNTLLNRQFPHDLQLLKTADGNPILHKEKFWV